MTPGIIEAPFTTQQVAAINAHQRSRFHPLTCCSAVNPNNCRDRFGVEARLVALRDGLFCETCDYVQTWVPEGVTRLMS